MAELNPSTTALVLIDLQNGIIGMPLEPNSPATVLKNSRALAERFRETGSPIVYIRVDLNHMQEVKVDQALRDPAAAPLPEIASEISADSGIEPSDMVITKRQWGAFFGTNLESELRSRKIKSIVVGGIATNYGVESTVRASSGLGFDTIVVEDATTTLSSDAHRFAFESIFPLIARVRSTKQVLAMLG